MPKYAIIDGFLSQELHSQLLSHALGTPDRFEPTRVRGEGQAVENHEIRRSWACRDGLAHLRDAFSDAVDERMDAIRSEVGVPPFPVGSFELELAAHRDGCFYRPHLDTHTGPASVGAGVRALSLVYYFHRQPCGFTGGELALYPFSPEPPVRLQPADNRLIAFPSFARHEVLPIICPDDAWENARFTVNCWYRKTPAG